MSTGELEAVCWDMDGTLIDSERYWIESEVDLVGEHGGVWTEQDAKASVGAALDVMARLVIAAGVDLPVEEVIRTVSAGVADRYASLGIPWRPGVLDLLQELRDAGVPQSIVTMSHADTASAIAEAAPAGVFQHVITGDRVAHGKPHPDPYLTALEHLGTSAAGTIAFEDSQTGVSSASAAGLLTIAVPCVLPLPESSDYLLWETLQGVDVARLRQTVAEQMHNA
ncbi:HAD family hydrolase [Pseudoclavibacter sp. CFCC 13796]|uniref:HAD family hydrolase n=1 Tax=Pseudoclavibacter sp. CFCC 13796 TaxID=2615179 RepID=UPI001300F615|nr:HAD family hydrolase [Pseudoclavibacter sp. CFCC 13796]KAB1661766.1 HAD family hydrolase [Pseudoclavibacter sp. CFCC 13796]